MRTETRLENATRLIQEIYCRVSQLEELFRDEERKFTVDGHLLGSFGEVLASYNYALSLFPPSHPIHDAQSEIDEKPVQIKITQGKQIGIRQEPEHLIVLSLARNGAVDEVYNGAGRPAWESAGRMQKNGQRSIGLSRLRALMPQGTAIPRRDKSPLR